MKTIFALLMVAITVTKQKSTVHEAARKCCSNSQWKGYNRRMKRTFWAKNILLSGFCPALALLKLRFGSLMGILPLKTIFKLTAIAVVTIPALTDSVSRAQTVYVANANNTIVAFNSSGIGSVFASNSLNNPIGLAFDTAGNLYVANSGHANATGSIEKFTATGVGTLFASSALDYPVGLAFDTSGNLYAANSRIATIEKFTTGGVGSVFAQDPGNNSVMWSPYGLAFDKAGNLYVANFTSSTIAKFTPSGGYSLFASTGLNNPEGLAFDTAGNLYVANYGNNTIEKFTTNGVGSVFASTGLSGPSGLAFDGAGNLYAVNQIGNTIEKFTPSGIGSVFASTGLNAPTFIAIKVPVPATLTIRQFTGNVIISWPTNDTGFTLQSTTNLVSAAVWSTVSPGPIIVNGQNAVTNPVSGPRNFYRLSQ